MRSGVDDGQLWPQLRLLLRKAQLPVSQPSLDLAVHEGDVNGEYAHEHGEQRNDERRHGHPQDDLFRDQVPNQRLHHGTRSEAC